MQQANQIRAGQTTNQTALLQLAELTRLQETEAAQRAFLQQHPEYALGQPPTSTLGSLQATPGPPGAITQTPMPGMPGQAVAVPAPQDLSQFATGQPPQSTLGAPVGPPQAPRTPLLDLARANPDAAFAVQARMQQQQDRQWKQQEQQLQMRGKVADYLGSVLQGARDQASYDAARQEVARVSPEWAQALPPAYSKEAVQPFIERALSVKDKAVLDIQSLQTQVDAVKAQAELQKARLSGRVAEVDNYLRAQGVQPGSETPEQMQQALAMQQRDKMSVSASHGTGQIVQTPQGYMRVNARTGDVEQVQAPGGGPLYPKPSGEEQKAATFGDIASRANATANSLEDKSFQPGFWDKAANILPMGMNTYLQSTDYQQYRQAVREFAQAWLRKTSGAAVTEKEWEDTNQIYFPQPGEPKAVVDQKRRSREALVRSIEAEGQQTGRQPTAAGQPIQAPAGTGSTGGGTVLTEADIATTMQASGKTRQQVVDAAKAKGYTVR